MSSSSKRKDFSADYKKLRDEIIGSTISERDKVEMTGKIDQLLKAGGAQSSGTFASGINATDTFDVVKRDFEKAKLGIDPVYKSRQQTQMLFNTMVDQPDAQRLRGMATVFGSSVRK
jgi:hypothetical protein